jgi:hypothetical protein
MGLEISKNMKKNGKKLFLLIYSGIYFNNIKKIADIFLQRTVFNQRRLCDNHQPNSVSKNRL